MTYKFPFDIAIVGGGACGLAVLLQLLDKASKGCRIVMFEKNASAGPGLAYSDSCAGTHINMHTHTMSIYANDPDHFARWMKSNPCQFSGRTDFPSRQHYGTYLTSLAVEAKEIARQRGIFLAIMSCEVIDLCCKSSYWTISLSNDTVIRSSAVVLAIGNSTSVIHKHLQDKQLYFDRPWPNQQLLCIPKDASVCILGSRLTAIDEALYLVEQGHIGPITLASRSGKLPKVQQANSKKYDRTFAMYNLARELEESHGGGGSIVTIVKRLQDEIRRGFKSRKRRSTLRDDDKEDDISRFRRDVEDARRGDVPGQDVLRATASVIERYWNCLGRQCKQAFMREYMSEWVIHRHAMPLHTAEKLLRLLESGQLQLTCVEKGKPVCYDAAGAKFAVPINPRGVLFVDAFVEATGIEYDAAKIEIPLMRNLLSRRILKPHFAGGVEVDFHTLEATRNLYVIGSMTRGVHFYSTAIDRNVAHAERLADSLLGLRPRRSLHIALFVGRDPVAQIAVGQLISCLVVRGHVPFLYLLASEDGSVSSGNDEGEFRTLLEEYTSRCGLLVQRPSDPSSEGFVRTLSDNHIDAGLSFMPDPSFSHEVLHYFQERQALWSVRQSLTSNTHDGGKSEHVLFSSSKSEVIGYSHSVDQTGVDSDAKTANVSPRSSQTTDSGLRCPNGCLSVEYDTVEQLIERMARGWKPREKRRRSHGVARLVETFRNASWLCPIFQPRCELDRHL